MPSYNTHLDSFSTAKGIWRIQLATIPSSQLPKEYGGSNLAFPSYGIYSNSSITSSIPVIVRI